MWIKVAMVAICLMEICDAGYVQCGEYHICHEMVDKVDDDRVQISFAIKPINESYTIAVDGEVLVEIYDRRLWRDPTFGFYSKKTPPTQMLNRVDINNLSSDEFRNESFVVKKTEFITDERENYLKWVSPPFRGRVSENFVIIFTKDNNHAISHPFRLEEVA